MVLNNFSDLIIRIKIRGYWYDVILIDFRYGVVKYVSYFAGLEKEHEEHFHAVEDIGYREEKANGD